MQRNPNEISYVTNNQIINSNTLKMSKIRVVSDWELNSNVTMLNINGLLPSLLNLKNWLSRRQIQFECKEEDQF